MSLLVNCCSERVSVKSLILASENNVMHCPKCRCALKHVLYPNDDSENEEFKNIVEAHGDIWLAG